MAHKLAVMVRFIGVDINHRENEGERDQFLRYVQMRCSHD